MFEEFFNEEEQAKHAGQPWYKRYKHVLLLIGLWLAFGVVCAILNYYFPDGLHNGLKK